MEHRRTTATREPVDASGLGVDDSGSLSRLETLLAANAEIERERLLYRDEREKFEAETLRNPIGMQSAFAVFGLMLGSLVPATIFLRLMTDGATIKSLPLITLLMVPSLIGSSVAGYASGKLVARAVAAIGSFSFTLSLFVWAYLGLLWGIVSGIAGGVFLFVLGGVAGAFVGGAVGSVALPTFAFLHRLLKRGESIEAAHFYPLSFGIVLTICAVILGL